LRRINYYDQEKNKYIDFMTNDFELPALTITKIFKLRWQIELFFKWIKQNLKIKEFYGYSENAVRTQLWIAIATYCLLAIIRKELGGNRELGEIQEILSASIFQKMPIKRAFFRFDTKNVPQTEQSDLFYQGL
jgi:IS4 transposase